MIRAKKRFGQNFLKNEAVLSKIIESMPKDDQTTIVEIGPGLGDLTKKLLKLKNKVVAFEVDLELYNILQEKFKAQIKEKRLELIHIDVLRAWSRGNLVSTKYHLVANLPYYIATNIILKALEDSNCISILVMIQKEVAAKFVATYNTKNFSALTILANSISKPVVLFDVDSNSFEPPPKVTSSVLKMVKLCNYLKQDNKGLFDSKDEYEKFKIFLKISFKSPRKLLINNLSLAYEKNKLLQCFKDLKIDQNIRPHQLSTSLYHLLFKKIVGAINARESKKQKNI